MKSALRQRLYPTLPSSPLDGWCASGLMTLAFSGAIATALWLSRVGALALWLSVLVPLLLLLGPQLTRLPLLGSYLSRHQRLLSQLIVLFAAILLGLAASQTSAEIWSVFLLLAVHGFALRYSRPDYFAALALLIPLIEMQLALAVLWPMGWLARALIAIWMILILLATAVIATWLHARWSRRHLRSDRHRYENEAETDAGLWGRARLILILGCVLVPIGFALQQGGLLAAAALNKSTDSVMNHDGVHSTGSGTNSADPATAGQAKSTIRRRVAGDLTLPSSLDWHDRVADGAHRTVVLHLKSNRDVGQETPYFSSQNPLYLLATTFERLDEDGLHHGPSAEIVHYASDGVGTTDWIVFDQELDQTAVQQFKILQHVMFQDQGGVKGTRGYLLHDRRLVAMKTPSCRLDEDGTALGELGADNQISYQWWSEAVAQDIAIKHADQAQQRYLALPDAAVFQDWILDARTLCADAPDSEDKLNRVLEHFQDNYRYDLNPSLSNSITAFAEFFAQKRGYCTYFAAAAMLYLRANGIPTRVATGFLVTEFSPTENAYIGRLSDAHAWLEVQQEDGSWRTVDPTPLGARGNLLSALNEEAVPLFAPIDSAEESAGVGSTAEMPPERTALRPEHGFGFLPLLAVLASAIVIVLIILIVGNVVAGSVRRRHQGHGAELNEDAENALEYWLRVRHMLIELGFTPRRSQTAAEFARSVLLWGGEFYRPLNSVTMLVYRARFGGYAWSDRELEYLERYEQMLAKKARASS